MHILNGVVHSKASNSHIVWSKSKICLSWLEWGFTMAQTSTLGTVFPPLCLVFSLLFSNFSHALPTSPIYYLNPNKCFAEAWSLLNYILTWQEKRGRQARTGLNLNRRVEYQRAMSKTCLKPVCNQCSQQEIDCSTIQCLSTCEGVKRKEGRCRKENWQKSGHITPLEMEG